MLALVKISAVFAVLVLMIVFKAPLGVSFIAGAVLTAVVFGMGLLEMGNAFYGIYQSPDTTTFVLIIAIVLALSMAMEKAGQIDRLTASLRGFMSNRKLACAILPAIVGLLPMPGGAIFSAPMVKAASSDLELDCHKKVEINYWFRHVWEYSWPLFPGVIFTAGLLNMEIRELLLYQFPLTITAIVMGFVFILRGVRVNECASAPVSGGRFRAFSMFVLDLSPFLLIFALYLVLNVPILISLLSAFALAVVLNLARRRLKIFPLARGIFTSPSYLNFLLMAYGVKFFGEMLVKCGAVAQISEFFISVSFPTLLIVAALPFIIGFISGITIVYCSAAFPLIIALPAVAANPIPFIVLAFGAGFMGTMLSPLHSCFVVSNEYFCASIGRVMLRLVKPAIGVLAAAFGLYFLYSYWRPFA